MNHHLHPPISDSITNDDLDNQKVDMLIDPDTKLWDMEKISFLIAPHQRAAVLATPIPSFIRKDPHSCTLTDNGIFSVKSVYHLAIDRSKPSVNSTCNNLPMVDQNILVKKRLLDRILKLKTLSKVHLFIWKLIHNALPVNDNRHRIFRDTSPLCYLCQESK